MCSIFLLFGGGREVWARLGIVSLFTCVINGISFEGYKTNLVPSFLPALSGSTCIISLANHYNTSVDAAIVQRPWCDDQVECMRGERGAVCRKENVAVTFMIPSRSWLAGGWGVGEHGGGGQWATRFFSLPFSQLFLFLKIVYFVKALFAFCKPPDLSLNSKWGGRGSVSRLLRLWFSPGAD